MDSSERPFHRQQWDTMFRKLVVYKQSHGHCNVPRRHACKALGEWVKNQRRSFAENSLLPRRLAALQSIGFVWETQNKGHGGKRKKGKKDRRKSGHKRPAASKDTNGSLGGDCSMEAPPPKRFRAEYDYSFAKKDEHRATSSKARNVGSFITSIKALIPTSLTRNPSSDLF